VIGKPRKISTRGVPGLPKLEKRGLFEDNSVLNFWNYNSTTITTTPPVRRLIQAIQMAKTNQSRTML